MVFLIKILILKGGMVVIKGDIIKFGYGDVVVGSCGRGYVSFTNIKPPLECGQSITKDINVEYGLSVTIYEDEDWDLYKLIKTVNKDNRVVKYRDYTLDFSNYNQKSVDVVKKHAFNTINTLVLAC